MEKFSKIVTIMLVFVLSLSSLFAGQRLFNKDAELEAFISIAGKTLPSFIYPVSGDFLLKQIERAKIRESLPKDKQEQFDMFIQKYSDREKFEISDEFSYDIHTHIAPEFYYTQKDIKTWALTYKDRMPFLKATSDFEMGKNFFGHFEVEFGKRMEQYKKQAEFNVNKDFFNVNLTYPHHAYLSYGTKDFNLQLTRSRPSASNGVSGNLAIGDNFVFRDFAKLSISFWPGIYELFINRFDTEGSSNYSIAYPSFESPSPLVLIHRLSMSVVNRVSLTLYEGIMAADGTSAMKIKFLNPFMMLHNTNSYNVDSNLTANNFFGLDVDVAITKGLSLNFQAIFDQIQLAQEEATSTGIIPNANGFLVNIKYVLPIKEAFLTMYIEGVLTSPGLYLKSMDPNVPNNYKNDLIVSNRLWDGGDTSFIGYGYGPNCIVLQAGAKFDKDASSYALDILYKVSGNTGLANLPNQIDYNIWDKVMFTAKTPWLSDASLRVQKLLQTKLSVKQNLFEGVLTLKLTAALQVFKNYCNQADYNFVNTQFAIGMILDPMALVKGDKK